MAFGLFKDGEELFNAAVEEIKRKEYDKAAKTLAKALEKNTKNAALAKVYIEFIEIGSRLNSAGAYDELRGALSNLNQDSFQFGLATFDRDELMVECEAMSRCLAAYNYSNSDKSAKGNQLMDAARNLLAKVGEKNLRIKEYYSGNSISGTRMATGLMAEASEILAQSTYWSDPVKAAEYQQQAYNFRRQNGEAGTENLEKMKQYSKACTCWICGRQVVGEGLHFFVMSADPSPQQIKNDDKELQHSVTEGGDLYVCRACYTAVSRRADGIAKGYYDDSIAQLRNVEANLQRQISSLDSRLSNLSSKVNSLNLRQ